MSSVDESQSKQDALSRTNMSMAIVCMVNSSAHATVNKAASSNKTVPIGCELPKNVRDEYDGEINWSSADQGWVFAALFWGSLATTPLAGWFADRFGPKYLDVIAATAAIIGSCLTPLAARASVWATAPVRLLIGLGTGLMIPASSTMTAKWFPPFERGTTVALYSSGGQLASIFGNPVAAYLCGLKNFIGGWPSIFYMCGPRIAAGLTVIFLLLWLLFAISSPEDNRFVSTAEKDYLRSVKSTESGKKTLENIPWRFILTSPVSLVNFANTIANYAGEIFLQTYLPIYFKDVLLLDLKQNGMLSTLPFILFLVVKFAVALFTDWLKRTGRFSSTLLSKICNSIGGFGSALCLIGVLFMDCSTKMYAVALSSLASGFLGFQVAGYLTSMVVIAPAYAGIINSCAFTLANFSLAIMPYAIGAITVHGTVGEWQVVFWIMIVILLISTIVFIIWGSADLQPWAMSCKTTKPDETFDEKETNLSTFQAGRSK